jgi:hypothetical protein
MRGGLTNQTGATAYEAATATRSASNNQQPPENALAGAIAATGWTHDDLLVGLTILNSMAFLALLYIEVTR